MSNTASSEQSSTMFDKTIVQPSSQPVPCFDNGCKVIFHFKTQRRTTCETCESGDQATFIDDTRTMRRPMELIFGKQFKLEVWEQCLRSMRIGEISRFVVDKLFVATYPIASKMIRTALGDGKSKSSPSHGHCCGMLAMTGGAGGPAGGSKAAIPSMGHADLDELIRNPCDLVFTFELLDVIPPGDYQKESWAMDSEEKLASIPQLKEEGNQLYRDGKISEAGLKYAEALGRLEQLMLREKPGDVEWLGLDAMKTPLLLNFAQCKFFEGEYYTVIEHTTEVLKREHDNVKALFRRAQAHVRAWNPDDARLDFERARTLDPSLTNLIDKELRKLDEEIRWKNELDKDRLMGKMF